MKIPVRRYDFSKGTVLEYYRQIPDIPPDTPLMSMLLKRSAKTSSPPKPSTQTTTEERNDK